MTDPEAAAQLDRALAGRANAPRLLTGAEGLRQLAALDGPDVVLNSVVGIAGLGASMSAVESRLLTGAEGLRQLAALDGPDVVLNSVVGIAGLGASMSAVESGHDLALANKESLVTGGHLVTKAVQKAGVQLLPVDSEHSAIL